MSKTEGEALFNQILKITNPTEHKALFVDGKERTLSHEEINAIARYKKYPYGIPNTTTYMQYLQNLKSSERTMKQAELARKLSFASRIDPLTNEEFDLVIERKLRHGYPIERAVAIAEKVKAELEAIKKEKAIRDAEAQRLTEEMNRFPNKFMRLCPYLTIKTYEQELTESAKQASLQDLKEARNRLMSNENPELTNSQKTTALTWLNMQIQNRMTETKKKSKKRLGLF